MQTTKDADEVIIQPISSSARISTRSQSVSGQKVWKQYQESRLAEMTLLNFYTNISAPRTFRFTRASRTLSHHDDINMPLTEVDNEKDIDCVVKLLPRLGDHALVIPRFNVVQRSEKVALGVFQSLGIALCIGGR